MYDEFFKFKFKCAVYMNEKLACSVRRVHKNKEFVDRNVVLSRKNIRVPRLLSISPLFEIYLCVQF